MPDEPYRPGPTQSKAGAEVARLAAEGQRRILEAKTEEAAAARRTEERARTRAERHLRVALGGHHGAPVRAASLAAVAVGALMVVVGLAWSTSACVAGCVLATVGFLTRVYAPPVARRASVAAERAWAGSLPFPIGGYFEALGAAPRPSCRIDVTLVWSDPGTAPGDEVLRAVLGVLDTGAEIRSREGSTVVVRSGPISGLTGIRVNDDDVCRNTRIVAYVHGLVDGVLLPLHQSHGIARVSLSRTIGP